MSRRPAKHAIGSRKVAPLGDVFQEPVHIDMATITRIAEDAYHAGPQGRRHEGERKLLMVNAVVDAVLAACGKVRAQ